MKQMFPSVVGAHTLSVDSEVDFLIGLGKASWQPQRAIKAAGGGDFWIWENSFGSCIGGSHPLVNSFTSRSDSLYTVLKTIVREDLFQQSHQIPTCNALATKVSLVDSSDFFRSEQLGTVVDPKCGSCRCGHCPVPGSRYSFREESELKLIEENLSYDEEQHCWVAEYPFIFPRETLKGSKDVAFKSMLSTECSLQKKGDWGIVYQEQIEDMLRRGAARLVPSEELANFSGHVNYIPHLAALNPRSKTTPVRICFDASRQQGGGPSLNQVLAKGPDRFLNNLAGVLVNFRNGRVAAKGDVAKMYNCVKLSPRDAYLQCFLWRNLDVSQEPQTYQVVVNNIGVKPAGAIATLALQKSTQRFEDKFPVTAVQLRDRSYVDDLGITAGDQNSLRSRTAEADVILKHANMQVKKWIYSGDDQIGVIEVGDAADNVLSEGVETERMLGIIWDPKKDVFKFIVRINLSPLRNKSRVGPDLSKNDLLNSPPKSMSRRQYYSQVQSLFDPIGLLAPVLLRAKMLLRKTWEDECSLLKWDDPLPAALVVEMVHFFIELFELEDLEFPRSLWPMEDVIGRPDLVIFSDGSVVAFGAVAYVRWRLTSGKWWTALIMSKSKIAPKNRITVPRLELNGAVLAKRLREFIVGQVDLNFGNIYHLVDSSTVLGYLHKSDSRLKPFEGIRVSEVQTSGTFVNGKLKNWSWVEGAENPADWSTKPRMVSELGPESFWQKGPSFLQQDYSQWPIKLDFKTEKLEGEVQPKNVHFVMLVSEVFGEKIHQLLQNSSNVKKLFNVVAYIYKWLSLKKNAAAHVVPGIITSEEVAQARLFWIRLSQQDEEEELKMSVSQSDSKINGRYRRLSVFLDEKGIWRVGLRLHQYTPFTWDRNPPAFLPRTSRFTELLMEQAHGAKHSGIDETVARFRMNGYWTPQAAKLAKKIKLRCVTCRLLEKKPSHQLMGSIPKELLTNTVAWGSVEMDLFGPFSCRSDVNKRSTIKTWGMIIVDKNSGAVHCDVVSDYSAQETVKTLRRFAAIRGWPSVISSDPGSQLESSSGSLGSWWEQMRQQLSQVGAENGFTWNISPANSPWRQGRAEVHIKLIKRLLKISVGNMRLTPLELQTVLFEAANLSNERPIGLRKTPSADGYFSALTPNCLLMGRSSNAVPDDTNLSSHLKKSERYELIQTVTGEFWRMWSEQVVPESVLRQKWHETGRNYKPGDIVLLHESSPIKGKYTLGIVDSVKEGDDSLVRSCKVSYVIPNSKDKANSYTPGKRVVVSRSIQRMSLLLPVEEQSKPMTFKDDKLICVP